MVEAEDKHAALRTTILEASKAGSNAPGWGYFGVSGSLAIGDNSYAPKLTKKPPAEDEEGGTIGNITTCPLKKGASTDVYFQFETPLALGDPYVDPSARNRKGRVWMLDPEAAFKPPGAIKKREGYEYVPHCDNVKDPKEIREKYRDYVPPRQMMTNPTKKGGGGVLTGGVLFGHGEPGKFPEHVPDDYDAAKKMRRKELEKHLEKIGENPAFKGGFYGNSPFANNIESFHSEIPTHIPRDKVPEDASRRYPHEAAFKPANPARRGVLMAGKVTDFEYMPDPVPGGATRKPPPPDDAPPSFKVGNCRQVTNPMPSVVTNVRNMRNERPSSFSRPKL